MMEERRDLPDPVHRMSLTEAETASVYGCAMCPDVREDHPGACPNCGMTLEPESPPALPAKTRYTCPMHPEIEQDEPGDCPICGMALEPTTVTLEEENPELVDMTRRFWVSMALTIPVLILAMGEMVGLSLEGLGSKQIRIWIELVFATPVML